MFVLTLYVSAVWFPCTLSSLPPLLRSLPLEACSSGPALRVSWPCGFLSFPASVLSLWCLLGLDLSSYPPPGVFRSPSLPGWCLLLACPFSSPYAYSGSLSRSVRADLSLEPPRFLRAPLVTPLGAHPGVRLPLSARRASFPDPSVPSSLRGAPGSFVSSLAGVSKSGPAPSCLVFPCSLECLPSLFRILASPRSFVSRAGALIPPVFPPWGWRPPLWAAMLAGFHSAVSLFSPPHGTVCVAVPQYRAGALLVRVALAIIQPRCRAGLYPLLRPCWPRAEYAHTLCVCTPGVGFSPRGGKTFLTPRWCPLRRQ